MKNEWLEEYNNYINIVNSNDKYFFLHKKEYIDDYVIEFFNIKLATYDKIVKPIKDVDVDAMEMRGVTFIFDSNGNIINRYLCMRKFFNINQIDITQLHLLKNLKIKNITEKLDGSLISFIKLPNGKLIPRTKGTTEHEISSRVKIMIEKNHNLSNFVNKMLDSNIIPLFEYVAPTNQIVLKYYDEELILIKLRCNITGKYLDFNDFKDDLESIKVVNYIENITLEDLYENIKYAEYTEGAVVHLICENGDDLLIKIKSDWYFSVHSTMTRDNAENDIIKLVIDEKLDDLLSSIPVEAIEFRNHLLSIMETVNRYISKTTIEIEKEIEKHNSFPTRKDYIMNSDNTIIRYITLKVLNTNTNIIDVIKEIILKDTFHLMEAKEWLLENGYDSYRMTFNYN